VIPPTLRTTDLDQVKELYAVRSCPVSFVEARNSFGFQLKNERRGKKMSFWVCRKNHRKKSNFVAFEKRNATAR